MTRYALVVMVDSDDGPRAIVNEIVSALEFEHRSTVRSVVVLNETEGTRGLRQQKGEDK